MHIREPIKSISSELRVREQLSKRKVTIFGEWHLWIQWGTWEILSSGGDRISNSAPTVNTPDSKLASLDGERLATVNEDIGSNTLQLTFDLGSVLTVRPLDVSENPLWSLFNEDQHLITYNNDGSMMFGGQ